MHHSSIRPPLRGPQSLLPVRPRRTTLTCRCAAQYARFFRSCTSVMAAQTIDGTAIAKSVRQRLHAEIQKAQQLNPRFKPTLRIIQGMP